MEEELNDLFRWNMKGDDNKVLRLLSPSVIAGWAVKNRHKYQKHTDTEFATLIEQMIKALLENEKIIHSAT